MNPFRAVFRQARGEEQNDRLRKRKDRRKILVDFSSAVNSINHYIRDCNFEPIRRAVDRLNRLTMQEQ